MIVEWTEFDSLGYDVARESYQDANPKDFEKHYQGKVIDKYHTFWGTPKFVVVLPDGEITTVTMYKCKAVIATQEEW